MPILLDPDGVDFGVRLRDLNQQGFWYLATPYSKYPDGIRAAYIEACRAAAHVLNQGLPVYCPIAHTHPIAIHGGVDPLNHDIWLPADRPFMDRAIGLIVCMMPTWEESYGISVEIDTFKQAGKTIWYMTWPQ